jgi:hypothetical protein
LPFWRKNLRNYSLQESVTLTSSSSQCQNRFLSNKSSARFLLLSNVCYFLCLENIFVHFLLASRVCYFLCLETKKVTKENSRLQIILGLLFFSLRTQYNSPEASLRVKQYCLLKPSAASFKIVAISQNYLRPFEIQQAIKMSPNILN